jgi:serine-type D-Ala-D-Ala carboxypeptidase (penicillin-binding protein 5/6)
VSSCNDRKQVYLSISRVLLALVALGVWPGARPAEAAERPSGVTCAACVVMDSTGRVLWGRAPSAARPNASTTKMVTALVAVGATEPGDLVQVSATAASVGGGGLDLDPGDVYTVRDLLHALLLTSSNEAAAALAEHASGSQEAFVGRMNRRAAKLGASGTHFVNPHGLDAPGHVSTAKDLARIALALLDRPLLARVVSTERTTIESPAGTAIIENRNPLLDGYPGALGVKTGRTLGAGDVLVGAARQEGRTVVTVAMASGDVLADSRRLLDFGFREAARRERALERERERAHTRAALAELGEPGTAIAALVFDLAGATDVVASGGDLDAVVDSGEGPFDVVYEPRADIELPLDAGERIGTLTIVDGGGTVAQVGAISSNPVPPSGNSWIVGALAGILRFAGWLAAGLPAGPGP